MLAVTNSRIPQEYEAYVRALPFRTKCRGADAHADCYDNYLRRKCSNAGGMSSGLSVIHFEIQSNYDSSLTSVVKLLLPALYPLTLCALSRDCMYF